MAEQTVTILAVLRDQYSQPLKAFQQGLASLAGTVSNFGANVQSRLDKPLADFRSHLGELKTSLKELKEAAEPLIGGGTEFAAAFFSVETIHKALEAAREAKQAEAQLLVALNGDNGRFDEIIETTEKISSTSAYAADKMVQAAATLASRGVGFSALPDALQLSADLAAKLGISIEESSQLIARTYAGQIPRQITQAIPALQNVRGEIDAGTKAINILRGQVSGAAQQFAGTDIGRIQQSQNQLRKSYEDFGKVLIQIEARLLPAATETFKRFLDALSSPFGKALIEGLTEILEKSTALIPYVVTIIGLFAAWRAGAIALNIALRAVAVAEVFAEFANPIGIAVIAITALTGVIVYLWSRTETGRRVIDGVAEAFKALMIGIKAGAITIDDIVGFGVLKLREFGINLKLYLFDIPVATLRGLYNYTVDLFTQLELYLAAVAKTIAAGFATAITGAVREIAIGVDKFTNTMADAVGRVNSGLADRIRTNLSSRVTGDFASGLVASADEAMKTAQGFGQTRAGLGTQVSQNVTEETNAANTSIEKLNQAFAESIRREADRHSRAVEHLEEETRKTEEKSRKQIEQLDEYHKRILSYDTDELRPLKAEIDLAADKNYYDHRLITVQEYIKRKNSLEQTDAQHQLDEQTALVSRLQAARLKEESGNAVASPQTVTKLNEETEKQVALRLKLQAIQQKEIVSDQQLLNTDVDRTKELNDQLTLRALRATGNRDDATRADRLQLQIQQEKELQELQRAGRSDREIDETRQVQAAETLQKFRETEVKTLEEIGEKLNSPFNTFFENLAEHTKKTSTLVRDMLADIAKQVLNFAISSEVKQALNGLFGDKSDKNSTGGLVGGLVGLVGGAFGFNTGGIVPGGGPDRDSRLIMATPGEGILRRTAVMYYGQGLIHSLNRLTVPRGTIASYASAAPTVQPITGFNNGGVVQPSPAIQEVVVAPTEEHFRRMVRGGTRALFDTLSEHRQDARMALGLDG